MIWKSYLAKYKGVKTPLPNPCQQLGGSRKEWREGMLLTAHIPVAGLLSVRYCHLSIIFLLCPCCAGLVQGRFCRQMRQHRLEEGQAVRPGPQHGPLLHAVLLQAACRLSSSFCRLLQLRARTMP